MPIEVKAYRCKFKGCKKYLLTKSFIVTHEDICHWNPEMQACATCGKRTKFEYDGENETYMRWYCMNDGKYLQAHAEENDNEMPLKTDCCCWVSEG